VRALLVSFSDCLPARKLRTRRTANNGRGVGVLVLRLNARLQIKQYISVHNVSTSNINSTIIVGGMSSFVVVLSDEVVEVRAKVGNPFCTANGRWETVGADICHKLIAYSLLHDAYLVLNYWLTTS
jgi:hypothetical protein